MSQLMSDLLFALSWYAIPVMIVLLLVSLGGLFSERSGIVNIALEGIMVMGGFAGAVVMWVLRQHSDLPLQVIVLIGLFTGAIAGLIFSAAHAFASIRMNSNQIISATALNLFAPALSVFVARTFIIEGGRSTDRINISDSYRIDVPYLSDLPFIGNFLFSNAFISTYIGFVILVIVTIVFYKTRLGLRIRSCGENPHAADSLGINVYKIRYIGVLLSGLLAGLGGAVYLVSFHNRFDGHVRGLGFLALALLISGQWKPGRIFLFAIIFASFHVVASQYDSIGVLSAIRLPTELYKMMPYLFTLSILAFLSKHSQAPKAVGEPYDSGKR